MSDQQQDAVEHLREKLEEMHGHRLAVTIQHVREGNVDPAVDARIEADMLHRVIKAIDHIQAGQNLGGEGSQEYRAVSQAFQRAEEAAEGESDSRHGERGLQ